MNAKRCSKTRVVTAPEPRGPEGLDALRRDLTEALDAGAGGVVVDLGDAYAIDGACLAVILRAARSLPADRRFSVVTSADLARSFAEWRLDTVLDTVESAAEQPAGSSGKE